MATLKHKREKLTNEFVLIFRSDTQSHLATNEGVAGSNPARSTNSSGV